MARPKRHNADYFSHDAGMRNDPKVKALRNKFGNDGYAVWGMMLEVLTASDYFTRSIDEIEIEILSADFGIEPELFSEILSYMVRLRLLQTGDNCEYLSQKLSDRMQSVVDKRRNSKPKGVSVTESTQSKVKESKVNKTKEEKSIKRFKEPTLKEVADYCLERKNEVNPDNWMNHYAAKGWMIGPNKMKDWKAAVRTWEKNDTKKDVKNWNPFS
jgi:hypothetical protein